MPNKNKDMRIIYFIGCQLLLILLVCGCIQNADSMNPVDDIRMICQKSDSNEFCYVNATDSGVIRYEYLNHDSVFVFYHIKNDSVLDEWRIPYPVYRVDCGDLTGDGVPEICVGVIKKTRYRPVLDKRLFIFKLHRGIFIRPLWLGSRVSNPLIDFCLERDSTTSVIHTWEQTPDSVVQILYTYHGFGIKFLRYHTE